MAVAAAGSAALLIGALAFQYLGGLAPCKMCLWQRWPHWAAIGLGLVAMAYPGFWIGIAGALSALTTAGIGFYHAGVEYDWWQGPTSCTGDGGLSGMSGAALLDPQGATSVVMCDQIVWSFAGLSMAGWNAAISAGLAFLWAEAALRARVNARETRH